MGTFSRKPLPEMLAQQVGHGSIVTDCGKRREERSTVSMQSWANLRLSWEARMKKLQVLAVILLSFGHVLVGCSSGPPTPSPLAVSMRVIGTAEAVLLQYECMDSRGFSSHYATVPWEKSMTCPYDPDRKIDLKAIFFDHPHASPTTSGTGTLTCEIYVGGELVDSASKTIETIQGWPSADCSYVP